MGAPNHNHNHSFSQVMQWPYCTRPVASPTWRGLHGTSSGEPCLSSGRRAERPTSCQYWRESRYLLEKDAPRYCRRRIWRPWREWDRLQGMQWVIDSVWTELRQNAVPLAQLCMSVWPLGSPVVGDIAAHRACYSGEQIDLE